MPVPRARPSARWQTQQVHAVLRPRHHYPRTSTTPC
jgi:hypothetical protein